MVARLGSHLAFRCSSSMLAAGTSLTLIVGGTVFSASSSLSKTGCVSWKGRLSSSITDTPPSSSLSENEQALRHRVAQSMDVDSSNRSDPGHIEPDRHAVVVLGVTGSGKSSTANTMRHRDAFRVSGSITSVTRSIAYQDYSFDSGGNARQAQLKPVQFRVIDTPGLQDTNRSAGDLGTEFTRLAELTPYGVSAFLICVPMGRVTEEHERVLHNLIKLFGGDDDLVKHSVVVVTSARVKEGGIGKPFTLLNRHQLIEQIGRLPPQHFLRKWVQGAGWRIVGVENILEPFRTQSALRLHQAVLDTVSANNGKRFMVKPPSHVESADAQTRSEGISDNDKTDADMNCSQKISQRSDGKYTLDISCVIERLW